MFFRNWRRVEAMAMSQASIDKLKEQIARSKLYLRISETNQTFDALYSQKRWCPAEKLRAAQEARNEAYADLVEFDRKCRHVPKLWPGPSPTNDWRST